MRNRFVALFVAILLGLVGLGLTRASAWTGEPGQGRNQRVECVSTSITTPAVVCSAVTGKKITVKAMTLSTATAGVVVFQDGASGAALFTFYVAANVPYQIDESVLGPGFSCTSGNALYAYLASATLTANFRIQLD